MKGTLVRRFSFTSIICLLVVFTLVCAAHADNGGAGSSYGPSYSTPTTPTFVPLANYGNATQFSNIFQGNSLSGYLNAIFETCISLGAIAAVVRIVYGGFLYMGSDIVSSKGKAREIISDATIGLVILLSIWLVLYQINPCILNLNAVLNSFTTTATGSQC